MWNYLLHNNPDIDVHESRVNTKKELLQTKNI
jgi:hypothetical protein